VDLHGKPKRRQRCFTIPNQWLKPKILGNFRLMVERIAFDAVFFCCGDILRKGVELTFRRGAVHGEDV
jgi:hypothetical protein